MGDVHVYLDKAIGLLMLYAPKFLLAIVVLFLGLRAIKVFVSGVMRAMSLGKLEPSLQSFLGSLLGILLKVLLFISVASMIGIATTSFVAILGAAGLAVGLALRGSLANFAGGVLILFNKPFKVGDTILAQGFTGKVEEVQIFHTVIVTSDHRTIIIPNGPLSGGVIANLSTAAQRRVDMTFKINCGDDFQKPRDILNNLMMMDKRILSTPEPTIKVIEFNDDTAKFEINVWCNTADYASIVNDMSEIVKASFDNIGMKIAFP
ncbi:mechanosensitive ion channel family protein [Candidatus Magnetobacterium casense]|uniref:Mechanosensitive ion channel n=1 Tax=Candidatus Magnetobacterium casense TaxID=1455061 RepID=A0ABS6RWD1_9BACT|nr:mechanosensitive ion channel domain-containing protein [Candidatus Magnetobacterium casensis]MBV6340935.1 mechanosensitive ion channel [Candidatus Magnetobacterium casensis]